MTTWLPRGVVFAIAMVIVRLFQGALIDAFPAEAGQISLALLALFVVPVVLWGLLDGLADAHANPDPDRRRDLAARWLLAGLVAGLTSGAVAWLISKTYNGLYVGGLLNELTTFAAFTALLVFLSAMAAVTLGRWLVDRRPRPIGQLQHGVAGEDRVDTDVFAAVRNGETVTDHGATAQQEQATAVPPAYSAETTEVPAEEYPTEPGEEQTRPVQRPEEGEP